MFHIRDGITIDRAPSGEVVIERVSSGLSLRMTPGEWASVVASVSKTGETAETYAAALRFHEEGWHGDRSA